MNQGESLKRTPLFLQHQQLNAKLVPFGGWEMPVQYTSILEEHQAVRNRSGMFDISHMGEVKVSGPKSAEFLNGLLTNDVRKLSPGKGQYSLMLNDRGGVIDDLYVYQLAPEEFFIVINASHIPKDFEWMKSHNSAGAILENISDATGAVAIQGPEAPRVVEEFLPGISAVLPKNSVAQKNLLGQSAFISRTGYTGEDGFEIFCSASHIAAVWNAFLQKGVVPCGLGARDTLRTEVNYPLHGNDLTEEHTPIEAGLGKFISFEKGDFIGRKSLATQKDQGVQKKLVAFKMEGRSAPPRPGYEILSETGQVIGMVCSGTQSPSLNMGIGMGYIQPAFAEVGRTIQIRIRERLSPAIISKKPLYQKSS